MISVYAGFDPREEAGSHVFMSSLIHKARRPVSVTPLHLDHFSAFYPKTHRDGSNAFIYTRFLIPFLQSFNGWAIYCDGADMMLRADIGELWDLRDLYKAVQVVPHAYVTGQSRKYVGTKMEADNANYPRKNWSSVMLINCNHFAWRQLTPENVLEMSGSELHQFKFLDEDRIGYLPTEWNWLDEYGHNPDAKLVHWTLGTPAFKAYENAPFAEEFRDCLRNVNYVTP